ncbi:hypothetical protein CYJ76_04650 [Kytococcus schroeteri]|uniref:Beta-lactamase-related domain-containing protein n=1 Tax=Kytococcus schroeteri TaxID=138300 RepID=A0A2I1PBI2_9MICO|nr:MULTISPECIES: serine hydrolase domain-containing protein [Kytococcus]OFS14808.1 hypothetical protein HMPREF3099_03375 [Kytococcus sp. HMSC28H12]PKZ41951.1 hypothetical protein CYJ76_04650 [Kytococcus schroeteri]
MTTISRRELAGLTAGAVAAGVAAPAPTLAAPLDTPAGDAVRARLRALIGHTAVGAVVSVRGRHGALDAAAGRQSVSGAAATITCRGRVSSITKMLVTTAVMLQIQKRTWTLQTTIDDVLPGLWPGRGRVTLRQLLSHTSGMPDALDVITPGNNMYEQSPAALEEACSRQYTDAQLVRIARGMTWRFTPGEGYSYSNTGFVVVGMMLEKVTGKRLENLLRTQVFRRTGMGQTSLERGFSVPSPQLSDYIVEPEGRYRLERVNLSTFSGAGAVMATSADVTDFMYNLFRGNIISQYLVDKMCTPYGAAKEYSYGLGLRVVPDDVAGTGNLYGHTGAGWGSVAHALSTRDGRRRMAYVATGRPYWWGGKGTMDLNREALRKAALRATSHTSARTSASGGGLDPVVVRGAARYDAEVAPFFG